MPASSAVKASSTFILLTISANLTYAYPDRAFDGTSQCGAAVSTFECTSTREGLQLNTACSNGDSFAGTSGVCVVPARASSGFQSGRSFVNSADNIGPGYCGKSMLLAIVRHRLTALIHLSLPIML